MISSVLIHALCEDVWVQKAASLSYVQQIAVEGKPKDIRDVTEIEKQKWKERQQELSSTYAQVSWNAIV